MRTLLPSLAIGLGLASLALTSIARADGPTFGDHVRTWADEAGYRITAHDDCEDTVESKFGGKVAVCFSAKHKKKVGNFHPRMTITEANYASEEKAKERVASLRAAPPGEDIDDESHKSYPLRAAFRLGDKVVVLTTDAFAFRPYIDRAAAELAKETGGTDVTCWTTCSQP